MRTGQTPFRDVSQLEKCSGDFALFDIEMSLKCSNSSNQMRSWFASTSHGEE
jgi:hypothetical protein